MQNMPWLALDQNLKCDMFDTVTGDTADESKPKRDEITRRSTPYAFSIGTDLPPAVRHSLILNVNLHTPSIHRTSDLTFDFGFSAQLSMPFTGLKNVYLPRPRVSS